MGQQYRVMIVDDDEDLRALLAASLRPKFEVIEAVDGLDALNRLDDIQPDIAILDVEMPLMDGFQLCEAIRRNPDCSGIPIVFLSGHSEKPMIMKGYASGGNLFMLKPLDPIRFLRNLEMTIDQQRPPVREKRHTAEQLKAAAAEAPPAPEEEERPEPKAPAHAPAGLPRMAPPTKQGARSPDKVLPRVMIVDNEEEQRELLSLTLHQDFEITAAHDGLDAITKLVEYQPDIILLDIMMPRMNGYQLLQSIRRNAAFWKTGVIIVSAKSSQRDIDYARKLGANDFIVKPYSTDDLLKRVKAVAAAPGFQIRAKKVTIQDIVEREYLQTKGKEEAGGFDERKRKYHELQEIIDEEYRKQKRKK